VNRRGLYIVVAALCLFLATALAVLAQQAGTPGSRVQRPRASETPTVSTRIGTL
jgi:hypothetical protein